MISVPHIHPQDPSALNATRHVRLFLSRAGWPGGGCGRVRHSQPDAQRAFDAQPFQNLLQCTVFMSPARFVHCNLDPQCDGIGRTGLEGGEQIMKLESP